ncbi:uncharacterized protein LOC116847188 [Odontomachus brunneus]|uniref:uncharacterized protein LOC116847188 n=1 Tax=Odontomachus brunneus TaxID=486640 RepID=UPI0013F1B2A4|nr:uncharacterized protein LOC116847188 [Odontomachus brunneus]
MSQNRRWPSNRSLDIPSVQSCAQRATCCSKNKRRKFDVPVSPTNRYELPARRTAYCFSVAFDFRTMPSAFAGVFVAKLDTNSTRRCASTLKRKQTDVVAHEVTA